MHYEMKTATTPDKPKQLIVKKTTSFRMGDDMRRDLEAIAEANGCDVATVIRMAIKRLTNTAEAGKPLPLDGGTKAA
jgi:antitoxin component of RelBE/YafQ-DinJ toxin-antitoxin module